LKKEDCGGLCVAFVEQILDFAFGNYARGNGYVVHCSTGTWRDGTVGSNHLRNTHSVISSSTSEGSMHRKITL